MYIKAFVDTFYTKFIDYIIISATVIMVYEELNIFKQFSIIFTQYTCSALLWKEKVNCQLGVQSVKKKSTYCEENHLFGEIFPNVISFYILLFNQLKLNSVSQSDTSRIIIFKIHFSFFDKALRRVYYIATSMNCYIILFLSCCVFKQLFIKNIFFCYPIIKYI